MTAADLLQLILSNLKGITSCLLKRYKKLRKPKNKAKLDIEQGSVKNKDFIPEKVLKSEPQTEKAT